MGRLNGKITIVTGGASGIGEAIVREFVEQGATVICADIQEEQGCRVVEEVTAAGGTAAFQTTDLRDLTQIMSLVEETVERYGRLDVLVNCAAKMDGHALLETSEDECATPLCCCTWISGSALS